MTEWLPTALGQGDEGSLPSTLDARGPLPSLRSPSSTTSGDFTSRGSSFPAIFQHAADTRALWWLVTQKHATAERRYSVHVSGASLRISWPGWRATGDQLTEVDHPEISERQLARTRAARGSKLQLSETRGRTRVLVVGVLSVAHTRRNYRQASLSVPSLLGSCGVWVGQLQALCGGAQVVQSPLTNPHVTAYERSRMNNGPWKLSGSV